MHRIRPALAYLCTLLTLAPLAAAETPGAPLPPPRQNSQTIAPAEGRLLGVTRPYRPKELAPINVSNSNRLDSLLRAGNIYLSMQDAIALALENNLDIEVQRYGAIISQANLQRAQAGGALRGVTPSISGGASSASAGGGASGNQQTGVQGSAATQASSSGNNQGVLIQQTGSAIPNLDPFIQGVLRFGHSTSIQPNTVVTGNTSYIQGTDVGQATVNQGFLTGTSYSFGYSDVRRSTNSFNDVLNPTRSASLTLNVTQHLLQGFGIAVNNRNIRQAKNNIEANDLQFRNQVISTVSNVMNLYWDLVSFNDDVKAKQQSLAYNQKLYSDNQKQVEIGTMAPIEIVRAEAEVAKSQQDLTLSQTRVLQQETIIKNVLSRNGISSPAAADSRIIPTDRIRIPDVEPVEPFQDMVASALRGRPEISQQRINIENARINLKGSRSQLFPTLDAFLNVGNNALVGSPTTLVNPTRTVVGATGGTAIPGTTVIPGGTFTGTSTTGGAGFFVGGYGNLFSQLFDRKFPDYSAGFQLNIPLRNRAAQADYVLDQVTLRQQELSLQKSENQVRVDVRNAIIGLEQARAVYQSAVKSRNLQEQTLDAEQKKLALGASTIFNVILVQRDLANAQSAEVAATSSYSKAKVELERATGQTLAAHNISVEEAFQGAVARPPSPLPALP